MMCGSDITKKLKLLYCLHLPGVVLPGELDTQNVPEDTEMAADATDFFIEAEINLGKTAEHLKEQNISEGDFDIGDDNSVSSVQGWWEYLDSFVTRNYKILSSPRMVNETGYQEGNAKRHTVATEKFRPPLEDFVRPDHLPICNHQPGQSSSRNVIGAGRLVEALVHIYK